MDYALPPTPNASTSPATVQPSIETPIAPNGKSVYNVPVKDIKNAENISVRPVSVPSEKDGEHVTVVNIIDADRLLMFTQDDDNFGTAIFYIYTISNGKWSKKLNLCEDRYYYLRYVGEKYILFETSTFAYTYQEGALILYDLEENTEKIIFSPYMEPPEDGSYIPTDRYESANNVVVWDEKVYFDDFYNTLSTLYAYDISLGKLDILQENAMNPILYMNQIWYFIPDETGVYSILTNGSESMKNEFNIGALVVSNDKLFTLRSMGEDTAVGYSLTGVFEWGAEQAIAESRGGNVIYGLGGFGGFVFWLQSMPVQYNCVYDVLGNEIVEFSDWGTESATVWGNNNVILLATRSTEEDFREEYFIIIPTEK